MLEKDFAKELLTALSAQGRTTGDFTRDCAAMGAVFSILVLYYGLFVVESEKLAALSIPAFFVPLVVNYFYTLYTFENRVRQIEEEVPDILLLASSVPEKRDMARVIRFMAENARGPLQEEFRMANVLLESGAPAEEALSRMKKRCDSTPLSRAIDMLLNSMNSGAETGAILRETAEDFMQTSAILRERAATATVEKYTMLFAGGIIVPLILGLLSGMINGLNISAIGEIGIGMAEAQRKAVSGAAMTANLIYIAEYAIIASAFVAFQENRQGKAVLYAMFLLPIGFAVYFLGKGI